MKARPMPLDVLIALSFFEIQRGVSCGNLTVLRRDATDKLSDGVIPIDTHYRAAGRVGLLPMQFNPRALGVIARAPLLVPRVQGQPVEQFATTMASRDIDRRAVFVDGSSSD